MDKGERVKSGEEKQAIRVVVVEVVWVQYVQRVDGERCVLTYIVLLWFLFIWCLVFGVNTRNTGEKSFAYIKLLGDILLQDILAHKQYKL